MAALGMGAADADLSRRVIGDAPVGIGFLDAELRRRFVNAAFTRATGLAAADVVGMPIGGTPFAADADSLGALPETARPVEISFGASARVPPFARVRYRRLDIRGRPAGIVAAVTEADPAHHRLAVLDAAATRIGTTLDIDTTCAEPAEFVVPAMADLAIVDVLPFDAAEHGSTIPPGGARLRRAAPACAPGLRPRLASLAPPGAFVLHREDSAVGRSPRTGVSVSRPSPVDTASDDRGRDIGTASNDRTEHLDTASDDRAEHAGTATFPRAAGIDTTLVVPLVAHGHTIGVLLLGRAPDSADDRTDGDAVSLVADLAARAAVAIDKARRHTHAQGIAAELQRALLTEPGTPHPNLELAFRYLPSGITSVGGDWYEVVRLFFGRTLLVMGDVMGHGIEAAVDMSNYRSTLRHVAATELPPHRILRRLDALIDEKESARPATCLLALADPGRRRWTFSTAGHLPPVLIAAGRPVELVEVPTGPPLGTGVGGYEQITRDLLPEETLLLYTDGPVERRDQDIDDSLAGLAALRPPTGGGLDGLLDAILDGLAPHTGEDDIAMLAARMRPR